MKYEIIVQFRVSTLRRGAFTHHLNFDTLAEGVLFLMF